MIVYAPGANSSLRADLIGRSVLRSDLTPVPQSIELEVRDVPDTAAIREGAVIRAGREAAEFRIVKRTPGGTNGMVQGDRPLATFKAVGILASCAPIAQRTQRSIVRYGASLGEVYRACGAQVRIADDFAVEVFACYKGMVPSFEIAKALQEEAGALVVEDGRVSFRRLSQMLEIPAVATLREDSAEGVESEFLERHLVPFAFSTTADNAVIAGRSESPRGAVYRPRAVQRTLNNISTALVLRRKVNSAYAPNIQAGMRVDVAGSPYVVITAAHAWDGGMDTGGGQQVTRLWLGEVVTP